MQWKCFVLLLVTVTAAAGQVQDPDDYDAAWWSDEASDEQLGIAKPDYDQTDDKIYNDDFEQPDSVQDDKELDNIEQKTLYEAVEDSDLLSDLITDQDNEEGNKMDLDIEDSGLSSNLFADQDNDDGTRFDQNKNDETINYSQEEDSRLLKQGDNFNLEGIEKKFDEADAEADKKTATKDKYSQAVLDENEQAKEDIDTSDNPDSNIDNLDDYQIEDNRPHVKEQLKNKAELSETDDSFEPEDQIANVETDITDILGANYPKLLETAEVPRQLDENLDQLSEETKELLEEENSPSEEDFENDQQAEIDVLNNENSEISDDNNVKKPDDELNQFFEDVIENQQNEEIKSYIDGNESSFDENAENVQEKEQSPVLDESIKYENDMINPEESNAFINSEDDTAGGFKELASELDDDDTESDEDTVDKVYEDLNSDLAKLFETMDKLTDNSNLDETKDVIGEYEEKYNKPYGEDTILSQRQDYDNYGDLNEEPIDSNLADIFDTSHSASDSDNQDDNIDKQLFDLKLPESAEKPTPEPKHEEEKAEETQLQSTVKTIDVEELKPAQYNDLMVQFAATHVEDIDTLREDYGRSIPAVHMTLTDTEATEITSPNYPNTYPTNNVIDWILEGEGTGIELNITDLELRGAQDDFLLIKPGGADDTGHDGLVLSYHLNKPRHYRFTDVSKVFVRFQTGAGLGFLKGFRMTVKMIWPPESLDSGEEPPTPAPLLPSPPSVLTVTLGGVGQKEFFAIRDEFQKLIADMATLYMFANGIEAGDNTTSEVTQLTSIAYCNVNWPNSEECVEVTFGVPLVYGEEEPTRLNAMDLRNMWETYSVQDPFAVRLRQMGIKEFAVPDDSRVLLAWLVLATGVILSAALLSFALWRYSCVEDYTRMKSFSDTDSMHEGRRGLDLYPTPHQTLPPLYAESDYKWADEKYDNPARVDMGGFTNRSYARDELVDIDSADEDVVSPRERNNTSITPRDMYQV